MSKTSEFRKGRYGNTQETSTTIHTYDDQGNEISSLIETDNNGDGKIDSSVSNNNSYDSNGKILALQTEFDSGADGTIDAHEETSYTYDSNGQLVAEQTRGDENNNGSFNDLYDYVLGTTFAYDEQGNVIQENSYSYQGFDGYCLVTDFVYDDNNRLIEESYENFDAYGDSTSLGRNSYGYDKEGRLVSLIEAQGTFGELTESVSTTNSYDDAGNLTLTVVEASTYEFINSRETTRNTFDTEGNQLSSIFERDDDANGQIDFREVIHKTYDVRGNQLSTVFNLDSDADGIIDSVTTRQQKFNRDNDLIDFETESPGSRTVYRAIYTDGQTPSLGAEKSGNDLLMGVAQRDTLKGGAGDDWIFGLGGHDLIVGNRGNDRLIGGNGYDTLKGGAGEDEFVFQKPSHKADRILDFNVVEDSILIQNSGFELDLLKGILASHRFTIGSAASDRGDRFIYNPITGALFFDADGTQRNAAIAIAYLGPNREIASNHILIA